jgi:hypothetical protein
MAKRAGTARQARLTNRAVPNGPRAAVVAQARPVSLLPGSGTHSW